MLKKEGYFFVEDYLIGALEKSPRWRKACVAAQRVFFDVVAKVNDARAAISFSYEPLMQAHADRFFSAPDFCQVRELFGNASLMVFSSDLTVFLEIELKRAGEGLKGLEMAFDESGRAVHIFIVWYSNVADPPL